MSSRELWYVCKRLMNAERVDALRKVMLAPEPMIVTQLADMLRIKEPATSQYLTQLEVDCGLVASIREGRYVSYAPKADPDAPRCEVLSGVLRRCFKDESDRLGLSLAGPREAPSFVQGLAGLSNEGRVRICLHLRKHGPCSVSTLSKLINQCDAGIRRHLRIIGDAGLCQGKDNIWHWREPNDRVLKTLLDLFARELP